MPQVLYPPVRPTNYVGKIFKFFDEIIINMKYVKNWK